MPKLSDAERDAFLCEPGVLLHLATLTPDGRPEVAPIWFAYEDGAVWFTPRAMSAWLGHLRRDTRVSLAIDEQPLPYRKVLIDGAAELVHDLGKDDLWRDLYRRIACRYIPAEAAEQYVQDTIDQPRALYRVVLAKARVRSWRMPLGEEAGTGIWHARYYLPGTKMAKRL